MTNGRLAKLAFATVALIVLVILTGCGGDAAPERDGEKRVIVLGFDGMDWELAQQYIAEGRMPNFERLAREGTAQPLGTAVPPLSPIAWSDFITGMDSGGHGIFDFIHRDPEKLIPEFAMAETHQEPPKFTWGELQMPGAGGVELLRAGTPFWETLEDHGVETTVVRMPVNFPPSEKATRELSGMGTPDLLGGYGTFTFYTSELFFDDRDISGGEIRPLDLWEGTAEGTLYGPPNAFRVDGEETSLEFQLHVDPEEPIAELVIDGERLLLAEGEWSDWVPFTFVMVPKLSLLPGMTLPGMARFYLRQVRPEVELYVTPINFDPLDSAFPVSHPAEFSAELAEMGGRYYTQGMPEDTKALTEEIFDRDEFLAQARIAGEEIETQFKEALDRYPNGLFFWYFGNLDQVSHVMMRTLDPGHPVYDPELDPQYAHVIPELYERADEIVGYTLDRIDDDTTLIVMSDHGFASWRRTFSLNTWLKENGYLALKNPDLKKDPGLFLNVDWSKTRAYGAGFNGLYVNLRGREKNGIVNADEKDVLLAEIREKLLEVTDPWNGERAITKVYVADDFFEDRGRIDVGPDAVIGYAETWRGSNDSTLGEVPPEVFTDNTEEWSGDHSMDHETVPGVLFTNRELVRPATSLKELAASVVAEFGIDQFPPAREGH